MQSNSFALLSGKAFQASFCRTTPSSSTDCLSCISWWNSSPLNSSISSDWNLFLHCRNNSGVLHSLLTWHHLYNMSSRLLQVGFQLEQLLVLVPIGSLRPVIKLLQPSVEATILRVDIIPTKQLKWWYRIGSYGLNLGSHHIPLCL